MTRGAIEWLLKLHTHDGSSCLRRLERRGGQFTRDPIEQQGEVGVGQATARDHVAGVDDTGVIARKGQTDTRKRGRLAPPSHPSAARHLAAEIHRDLACAGKTMAALAREHLADAQAERARHGVLDVGDRYASGAVFHDNSPPVVDVLLAWGWTLVG